ncbi:MAG: peptidylprolyl isomerase [Planctomycetota bacterium]|jgi:parvulin-like peptidyl-prolyl isomerase|nr:peptidylprolyl isomerase [Planctomycetota bacterium]MDP6941921.1 peptidylprolyl isomerase [Planctomycetota bacterium]
MILSILLSLALPQEPSPPEPLPEGIIARINDVEITKKEYLDFLYARFGKRALEEYLANYLLEKEADAYGIQISEEDVSTAVLERESAQRGVGSSAEVFEANLKRGGQNLEGYRATLAAEIRLEKITDALIFETRVATDENLQILFERKYGLNGKKLRVKHIVIMPNVLRAELLRSGQKPTEVDLEALHADAQKRAEDLRARLIAGEDFAALAKAASHDRVTRERGGELLNYNGRLYGPDFFAAVDSLPVGESTQVIRTGAGYHIAQVIERTQTQLEDVRKELVQNFLSAPPSWQERNALVQALRERAKVQVW